MKDDKKACRISGFCIYWTNHARGKKPQILAPTGTNPGNSKVQNRWFGLQDDLQVGTRRGKVLQHINSGGVSKKSWRILGRGVSKKKNGGVVEEKIIW